MMARRKRMSLRRLIQINFNRGFVASWLALSVGLIGLIISTALTTGWIPQTFAVICLYGGYFTLFYIVVGLATGLLMDFLFQRIRE